MPLPISHFSGETGHGCVMNFGKDVTVINDLGPKPDFFVEFYPKKEIVITSTFFTSIKTIIY